MMISISMVEEAEFVLDSRCENSAVGLKLFFCECVSSEQLCVPSGAGSYTVGFTRSMVLLKWTIAVESGPSILLRVYRRVVKGAQLWNAPQRTRQQS
jgi:hypothetical protein